MKETLAAYIKRVRELVDHVRDSEQATKHSLIGPLFTLLGYDMTDPRQVMPEFKCDFGKERSRLPIDWAFMRDGKPMFFVEAKAAGKKLTGYDEQLADYFAKAPEAKMGILTNGVTWRFFTDLSSANIMDKEPFVKWDVLNDEHPPIEFLTVLQRESYNASLLATYAQRTRQQNLLVAELTRLLEPSSEFTKMAIQNLETRNLKESVIESWKPVVASALNEWSRQRALSTVLSAATRPKEAADEAKESTAAKIVTTQEELDGFSTVQRLLGTSRPVSYEDTASYFKIHVPEKVRSVVCRLYFDRKKPEIRVPLAVDKVAGLVPGMAVKPAEQGWACVTMETIKDLDKLADVLRAVYDGLRSSGKPKASEGEE